MKKCTEVAKPYSHGIGYYTPDEHLPVNFKDEDADGAIEAYREDPHRNVKWAGDWSSGLGHPVDMFNSCPNEVEGQDPRIKWRFNSKNSSATVKYDAVMQNRYCDLMVEVKNTTTMQVKTSKDGKPRTKGEKEEHIEGLREILTGYGMSYEKYIRVKKIIKKVGGICFGAKDIFMRPKLTMSGSGGM